MAEMIRLMELTARTPPRRRPDGSLLPAARASLHRALVQAIDCLHCLSLWIAAPLALFVAERWLDRVVIWLALSGTAFPCLNVPKKR